MEKSNYEFLLIQNYIKVFSSLLICLITMILIIMCNQIPRIEIDLTDKKYQNTEVIDISLHNPNSFWTFFVLRDISKAEYFITMPDGRGEKDYFFQNRYDGVEFYGEDSFSEQSSSSFILLNNSKKHISFYTKFFKSESKQSIRTFLLTEIFTFFLAVLGLRLYSLYQYKYRKKYGHSRMFDKRDHLKFLISYSILSIICLIFIFIICKSPTIVIDSSHYYRNIKNPVLMPYDISKTYYSYNINTKNLSLNDTITWESSEFVEFSNIYPKPELKTANSVGFIVNSNDLGSFETNFCTINYESNNIQEIRLFLLTTIFLLLLSRIGAHLIKYLESMIPRWRNDKKGRNKKKRVKK